MPCPAQAAPKIAGMYVCRRCGKVEGRALPLCPACGTWNAFLPFEALRLEAKARPKAFALAEPLFRVLGDIPAGSVLLLAGEPGVGKSTLALQVTDYLGREGPVVYVCGEERAEVVAERAKRLGVSAKDVRFLEEFLVGRILRAAEGAVALVVDSLPTVTTRASLTPGGPQAQREAALELLRAKSSEPTYLSFWNFR